MAARRGQAGTGPLTECADAPFDRASACSVTVWFGVWLWLDAYGHRCDKKHDGRADGTVAGAAARTPGPAGQSSRRDRLPSSTTQVVNSPQRRAASARLTAIQAVSVNSSKSAAAATAATDCPLAKTTSAPQSTSSLFTTSDSKKMQKLRTKQISMPICIGASSVLLAKLLRCTSRLCFGTYPLFIVYYSAELTHFFIRT